MRTKLPAEIANSSFVPSAKRTRDTGAAAPSKMAWTPAKANISLSLFGSGRGRVKEGRPEGQERGSDVGGEEEEAGGETAGGDSVGIRRRERAEK